MIKKPSEFAINMNLDKMMILQQSELHLVTEMKYFDDSSPCHLYFIGKRPRVTILENSLKIFKEYFELTFRIQKKNNFEEIVVKLENNFSTNNIKLNTAYPFNTFEIYEDGKLVLNAKTTIFLQSFLTYPYKTDFLDFEILYIGQSYGVEGARTAPDRLVSHSTLQGIYSEAIINNPDNEIWIALASFEQINLMMFDGRTKFTDEEKDNDRSRFINIYDKLNYEGINEQQKINFTEAALIKYFQPPYNKIYKDSFPNPAHKTYSECYDLDINSICIELQTSDIVNCMFFSEFVNKTPIHMKDFQLHSTEERRSMFDFS
jgi:hypothetical protein